jgi:CheY-like chemotaxis protein
MRSTATYLSKIEAAAPAVEGRLAGLRVLLAEDERDNQRLISTHLRRAGAEVTVVDHGQLAVESALYALVAGEPFHVVLMDMRMPVLDGYGATASLRARRYPGPIVALTAHAMSGDRDRCLRAGCDDYLSKPFKRAELVETVLRTAGMGWTPSTRRPAAGSYGLTPITAAAEEMERAALNGEEMQEMARRVGELTTLFRARARQV